MSPERPGVSKISSHGSSACSSRGIGLPRRRDQAREQAMAPRMKGVAMCRWLAYSGSPILIQEALYEGPNSLVGQTLHSRLGAEPTNGDGFGVGWYGAPATPGVFHSTEPAWNDRNLRELSEHISSPLFFTHIR